MTMMKAPRCGLAALLLAVQLGGPPAHAQQRGSGPQELDRIVAIVNDDVITYYELRNRLRIAEQQLQRQQIPLPPGDVLERQVLERLVVDRAQIHMARESGVRVDDVQLDAAIGRIADNNRMNLSQFRAALEADGIRWASFREDIRNEMTIARLREREVENRIVVSEGEIDNFLENPSAVKSEEFHLAHIVLRVPEQATPEQIGRTRARADEALRQIRSGAQFAQVAAAFSDAPDALKGGDLGWRQAERLPTLFAEAAGRLRPEEVSPILRSPAGFHILKLLERRGGAPSAEKIQQTHARHILIKTSEVVPEAEARRRLVALKERIDNGADFAELAKLNSNDLSATRGGDLGWIYPGDTVPEFERAMNALQPGQISDPLQSPFGWHLIQVLERRVDDASQERRRQIARQALRERKLDEAYEEWVRQVRDRAYVELRLDER